VVPRRDVLPRGHLRQGCPPGRLSLSLRPRQRRAAVRSTQHQSRHTTTRTRPSLSPNLSPNPSPSPNPSLRPRQHRPTIPSTQHQSRHTSITPTPRRNRPVSRNNRIRRLFRSRGSLHRLGTRLRPGIRFRAGPGVSPRRRLGTGLRDSLGTGLRCRLNASLRDSLGTGLRRRLGRGRGRCAPRRLRGRLVAARLRRVGGTLGGGRLQPCPRDDRPRRLKLSGTTRAAVDHVPGPARAVRRPRIVRTTRRRGVLRQLHPMPSTVGTTHREVLGLRLFHHPSVTGIRSTARPGPGSAFNSGTGTEIVRSPLMNPAVRAFAESGTTRRRVRSPSGRRARTAMVDEIVAALDGTGVRLPERRVGLHIRRTFSPRPRLTQNKNRTLDKRHAKPVMGKRRHIGRVRIHGLNSLALNRTRRPRLSPASSPRRVQTLTQPRLSPIRRHVISRRPGSRTATRLSTRTTHRRRTGRPLHTSSPRRVQTLTQPRLIRVLPRSRIHMVCSRPRTVLRGLGGCPGLA